MADIFISYAREDKARAEQIAQALNAAGVQAFWDTDIPPGTTWADYIEQKLTQCKAVVVLWSEHSARSQWVREEARMGRERGRLIPAMLDKTPAPFGFGEVQAADLSGWSGEPEDANWRRFLSAVQNAVGAAASPAPPPPPRQPSPSPWATAAAAPPAAKADGANMGFIDYVKKCFSLYVNGKGRARRAEYWWWTLFVFIVSFIAGFLDALLFGFDAATSTATSPVFTILVSLALICPAVSVGARRLHDIGLSGWLMILGVIPYIGWAFMLVVALIPGKAGPNQYGPNPKEAADPAAVFS